MQKSISTTSVSKFSNPDILMRVPSGTMAALQSRRLRQSSESKPTVGRYHMAKPITRESGLRYGGGNSGKTRRRSAVGERPYL